MPSDRPSPCGTECCRTRGASLQPAQTAERGRVRIACRWGRAWVEHSHPLGRRVTAGARRPDGVGVLGFLNGLDPLTDEAGTSHNDLGRGGMWTAGGPHSTIMTLLKRSRASPAAASPSAAISGRPIRPTPRCGTAYLSVHVSVLYRSSIAGKGFDVLPA